MKPSISKRLIVALLAFALAVGMVPAAALSAFAADKIAVTEIVSSFAEGKVYRDGMAYRAFVPSVPEGSVYAKQVSMPDCRDEDGILIDTRGNRSYGEWYDIRYMFEAGRTYTVEQEFVITPAYEETHEFANDPVITLNGPDPSTCSYTAQVVSNSGDSIKVLYSFTIAGERSYPDIKSATLQKIATPAEGVMAQKTALMYNNCTLASQSWSHGGGAFEAGKTYTLTVNLKAKEGYRFADDFAPVLGIIGYEKAADGVELLSGNTEAIATFVYPVGDFTFIDELQLTTNRSYDAFVPRQGKLAYELTFPFEPSSDSPYQNRATAEGLSDPAIWYNETDGCSMSSSSVFEAGKVYSIEATFDIKKDAMGEYRFVENPTAVIDATGFSSDKYKVTCRQGGGTSAILAFSFVCQFPQGAGEIESNPAVCSTFAEFRYAMENPDIACVALGKVDEALPTFEGEGPVAAVSVEGNKFLNLIGDASFAAPAVGGLYDCLMMTEAGSKLYVGGSGSLEFRAVGTAASNAVIRNAGGRVLVNGGTLIGSYNTATYGMAIWQDSGNLEINDGRLFCENANPALNTPHYPVYLAGGKADIFGGSFSAANVNGGVGSPYGIGIAGGANAKLHGGSFRGIFLDPGARVGDYLAEGCAMACDGRKVDAAEYASVPGSVLIEFYQEISKVEVHINAPIAGEAPSEIVYLWPEGCSVDSVKWYEDAEPLEDIEFKAGRSYSVEIAFVADVDVKFADPLEKATINYKNASVSAYGGDAEKGVLLSVNFGECPDTIGSVRLAVDAPRQHAKPDQSVDCASAAYRQALVGENMWDVPVYWEESSDGAAWTRMDADDTFTVGCLYKASVNLIAAEGYEFAVDPQIEPDVTAEVNGYSAEVFRYPEEDPRELICVTYAFGMLNDSVIEQIDIEGVTEPVVGEKPSYGSAIAGIGYHLDDAYNDGVIQNGVGWWDCAEDAWMSPDEVFQIGRQYKAVVYVETDDGYEFYTSGGDCAPEGWGYINGNYATFGRQVQAQHQQTLSWVYSCQPKTVKSVAVMDLEFPAGGCTPDFEAVADSEYYAVGSITWFDYENDMSEMTSEDAFVAGNKYFVMIEVAPVKVGSSRLCKFIADKTTASLNGIGVLETGDGWQMVDSGPTFVRIWFTFEKASGEAVRFVSGQVTSQGDEGDPIILQLIPEGYTEVAYELIVTGNKAHYCFADVADGSYVLKVSKPGHVTSEYDVVVDGGSVVQDCELVPIEQPEPVIPYSDLWKSFPDVKKEVEKAGGPENVWYVADGWLDYVVNAGLMSGYSSNGWFGPYDNITRGQVAVILYRAECALSPGLHEIFGSTTDPELYAKTCVFEDMEAGVYYTAAVNWAKDAGILTGDAGTNHKTVRPNDPVSRQELCVMLDRYVNGSTSSGELDPGVGEDIVGMDKVADWAKGSVNWCVNHGIIYGVDNHDGTYSMDPTGKTWRSAAAKMFTVVMRDVIV